MGLQTQGLNNTYVRECVVHVSACLSVRGGLSVYACSGVRVSETWSYV